MDRKPDKAVESDKSGSKNGTGRDGGSDTPPSNMSVSAERRIRMLRTAMGPEIAAALEDPEVVEVLLNPDGTLWLDRLGTGRAPTGITIPPAVAERIIRLVAAHVRAEIHAGAPILSAELPETGERFQGVLPPVVRAPSFAIRKRALHILTLARYVADGVLTEAHAASTDAVHVQPGCVVTLKVMVPLAAFAVGNAVG